RAQRTRRAYTFGGYACVLPPLALRHSCSPEIDPVEASARNRHRSIAMELATDPIHMTFPAAMARGGEVPPLPRIDHAMAMVRTHLLECAAQDDWSEHRVAQLIDLFRTCIGHTGAANTIERSRTEAPLPRHVLRQVFRFVHDHLDTKLKWEDIAL